MASTKWQQQKMDRTNKRHPLMVAAQRIHGAPVRQDEQVTCMDCSTVEYMTSVLRNGHACKGR